MNGKSRPTGGSQTPAKKSTDKVTDSAHRLLRDSLATGDVITARLVAWLLDRAA